MSQIVVTISPDGETKVYAAGIDGPSCKDVTRNIEKMLGKTVSDSPTSEMHTLPGVKQGISQ